MCISGSRSTVTCRTHKFIQSFTVATEHKMQWASGLNCTALVGFQTEIVLSCPHVFLHKFGRQSFPSVSGFGRLLFTTASKCSALKDEAAEGKEDMWRRDRMNTQTATLFQSSSEFPLAWMKHWRVHGLLHSNTASTGEQIHNKKKKKAGMREQIFSSSNATCSLA